MIVTIMLGVHLSLGVLNYRSDTEDSKLSHTTDSVGLSGMVQFETLPFCLLAALSLDELHYHRYDSSYHARGGNYH